MDNSNDITVLSLCTGYGGLELGLHRALGRPLHVVAVEIEAYAQANLVAKAEEGKLAIEALYPDIKTFPARRFSGCFDFILAGYPCQPFSVAGKRKGESDERHLWPFIKDCVQQIRPVWCFFENVAGHLQLGFDAVVADLDGLGYTFKAGLFTASEIGAPHKRERLFILAVANGQHGRVHSKGWLNNTEARSAGESELADPSGLRRRGRDYGEPAGQGRALQAEGPSELADAGHNEPQGWLQQEVSSERKPCRQSTPQSGGEWPARPGQEQYEWEEPRTVESSMGRTVDGFRSRVDELRLLGNGVVPAQAELAFRTLYEDLTK